MRRAAVVAVLLVLTAVACAGGGDADDQVVIPPSTTESSSTSSTPSSTRAPLDGSTTPTSVIGSAPEVAHLLGVEVHDDGGTVTFSFDGAPPDVHVRFADEAIADGSGETVEVDGAALLEVRMTPATGVRFEGEAVIETYTGPERVAGAGVVAEVVRVGDFEANLTWVIGLRRQVPFRASLGEKAVVIALGT